jgi:hypothetical protein
MNTPPPAEPPEAASQPTTGAHELGSRARGIATIAWSGFLAAALATMLCFAFLDPQALRSGETPEWFGSRLHAYAVGFFFFWLIGVVAAALCWQLTRRE